MNLEDIIKQVKADLQQLEQIKNDQTEPNEILEIALSKATIVFLRLLDKDISKKKKVERERLTNLIEKHIENCKGLAFIIDKEQNSLVLKYAEIKSFEKIEKLFS